MIAVNYVKVGMTHFPDGTQLVKCGEFGYEPNGVLGSLNHWIYWRYESDEELVALYYLVRKLREIFGQQINLILQMPYVPNARMDRVKNKMEILSMKYFAELINMMNFSRVEVFDPHSDVSAALLNNVNITSADCYIRDAILDMLKKGCIFRPEYLKDLILYYPDAGAMKRYNGILKEEDYFKEYCNIEVFNNILYGEKKRDWGTGEILGLEVKKQGDWDLDFKGKKVLMIDDIISYGGTLAHSAKKLKEMGAEEIYAYASHTENSVLDEEKGTLLKCLKDGIVKKIYTTDSLYSGESEFIKVFNLY